MDAGARKLCQVGTPARTSPSGREHATLEAPRESYYKVQRKRLGVRQSVIHRITVKMLGKHATPSLKAKAAETRCLLRLMPDLCRESSALIPDHLQRATGELVKVYTIMEQEPRRMSKPGLLALQQAMTRHLSFWGSCTGGQFIPKHHFAWHLVERAGRCGNPRTYWTYRDEGENRQMKRVAASLHAGPTFYAALLTKVLPEVAARSYGCDL